MTYLVAHAQAFQIYLSSVHRFRPRTIFHAIASSLVRVCSFEVHAALRFHNCFVDWFRSSSFDRERGAPLWGHPGHPLGILGEHPWGRLRVTGTEGICLQHLEVPWGHRWGNTGTAFGDAWAPFQNALARIEQINTRTKQTNDRGLLNVEC